MATIKSYTDIEQSRKLAEILSLESADTILDLTNPDLPIIRAIPYEDSDYNNKYLNIIPCWSLAALLNVLPKIQGSKPTMSLHYNYITYPHMSDLYTNADNLVDACYKMIIYLNELNLL